MRSLNSAGVEYLVLGGSAVIYQGYRRVTDDLDMWVAVNATTTAKVSHMLQTFGGFPAATVKPSMFQEAGKVFMFGRKPVRIDILTGWDGIRVPLISLEDLKANKLASGRPKDLADVYNLPAPGSSSPSKRPRGRQGLPVLTRTGF